MAATESAKMQKKSLNSSPDQTRTFEKEKIELANLVVMLLLAEHICTRIELGKVCKANSQDK
jgi:hypothetical protein